METVVSFPEKVSFFSLLAVIGVALGVNVMIVVVAFMKGFQHKFREDIIDAQGHARSHSFRSYNQLAGGAAGTPGYEGSYLCNSLPAGSTARTKT